MQAVNCDEERLEPTEASPWGNCCMVADVVDLLTDCVVMIDSRLKVVCANHAFVVAFGQAGNGGIEEYSLGEILKCRHAVKGLFCGTTEACNHCGWYVAVEACRAMGVGEQECRILTENGTAYDFSVKVVPACGPSGTSIWLCRLTDISAQKRLRVLERAFYHDIANLAIGIRGIVDLLRESGEDGDELRRMLGDSANKLVAEIDRLRTLRVAENGDVRVWYNVVSPREMLAAAVKRCQEEADARHLDVVIEEGEEPVSFETDRDLFLLVMGELLLNAIEASSRGNRVTLSYQTEQQRIVFCVRNPAVMDPAVQRHVFERSFTTKGSGHGVGTYRARLIAERCLKGTLCFTSRESEGTAFYVSCPLAAPGER